MKQSELNRRVAKITGETVAEISHRGFIPLTPFPLERDPEDLILDWDRLHAERNTAFYRQPDPLAVV